MTANPVAGKRSRAIAERGPFSLSRPWRASWAYRAAVSMHGLRAHHRRAS